jgi:type III restriction enzyme
MVARVCGDLEGLKDVIVINDEAHHCYRVRPEAEAEERGRSDQAREARENNEAARLWIAGLEAVARQIGIRAVYDLSATPFFLSGSGYPPGSLFPWVVSDFSLVDAIECGVVKLPRVPVSDNLPTGEAPLYRNLWPTVRDRMPTGTRGGQRLDPQDLPLEVKTALDALYGHYEKTFDLWEKRQVGVPPVFIVVCANTVASELVYEYIAGYERTDEHQQTTPYPARFDLFSNFAKVTGDPLPVPRTLLIDSIQIEKGDTIDDAFRKAAAEEIDRFRRDKIAREGAAGAEKITDAELLREAMNTVGRQGRLGEQIRCVVSVGMLTEGWDANTVTHILGLRAFGSRLLCEQVMGRALRRLSYELHDTPDGPRYRVEYADIMGIDGLNLAPQDAVRATPTAPRPMVRIEAVTPDRDACEIRFPRVEGYRVELPDTAIAADWSRIEPYVLTPEKVGPCETVMRGIVGAPETLTLQHLERVRDNEIIVKLTGHLVFQKLRDGEDRPIATLIPKIKPIVRRFLDDFVDCHGGTMKAQLMHLQLADEVANIIVGAINLHHAGTESQPIRAVLAPYAPTGSTLDVGFNTATEDRHWANPLRSHVNWIVWDGSWERNLAERLDIHPRVIAYAKNHALGFEVPYRSGAEPRRYRPDYIVRVDDGRGGEVNLVLEVKGFRNHDAMLKATTMTTQWIPGVNRLGHFGRWAFAELREIHDFGPALDRAIAEACGEVTE